MPDGKIGILLGPNGAGKSTIIKSIAGLVKYTGEVYIKGIPFDVKNSNDIYWFYFPLKTTYFYFVVGIISTVYIGEFLKFLKRKIFAVKEFTK